MYFDYETLKKTTNTNSGRLIEKVGAKYCNLIESAEKKLSCIFSMKGIKNTIKVLKAWNRDELNEIINKYEAIKAVNPLTLKYSKRGIASAAFAVHKMKLFAENGSEYNWSEEDFIKILKNWLKHEIITKSENDEIISAYSRRKAIMAAHTIKERAMREKNYHKREYVGEAIGNKYDVDHSPIYKIYSIFEKEGFMPHLEILEKDARFIEVIYETMPQYVKDLLFNDKYRELFTQVAIEKQF